MVLLLYSLEYFSVFPCCLSGQASLPQPGSQSYSPPYSQSTFLVLSPVQLQSLAQRGHSLGRQVVLKNLIFSLPRAVLNSHSLSMVSDKFTSQQCLSFKNYNGVKIKTICCVGQKVHLGFSIRCYKLFLKFCFQNSLTQCMN